jgi:hypothetical protein
MVEVELTFEGTVFSLHDLNSYGLPFSSTGSNGQRLIDDRPIPGGEIPLTALRP